MVNSRMKSGLLLLIALTVMSCGGGESKDEKLARIAVWEDEGWTADGELTKLLFDGDAGVRRRAALALARVNDTLSLDSLGIVLQSDRDPDVRAMAAFAIGSDKWRRGGHFLLDALPNEDDPTVLVSILQACGRVYVRDQYEQLYPFLRHPDPGVRAQTALTFDMINRHADVSDSLATLLNDPDLEVRNAALFALIRGQTKSPDIGRLLLPLTTDSSPDVRCLALKALSSVPGAEAEDALLRGLQDPSPQVRAATADGLALRRDTLLILNVLPLLETESNPHTLTRLVNAVAEHWRTQASPYLVKLLDHPDPGVRAAAVSALSKRMDFDFLDLIRPAASDPEPKVRMAYLTVLQDMTRYTALDTGAFVSEVDILTRDPVPSVRAMAVQTLMTVGGADWSASLNRLYHDSDFYCQQLAINLIGTYQLRTYQDSLFVRYEEYRDQWRPELKWSVLASTANMSPSVHADEVRRQLFDWGMSDPNRLVRWYTIAVWEKFREDHRDELGVYKTDLTVDNVADLLSFPLGNPTARLQTTRGPITVELRADLAPRTVRQFMKLARGGVYDGSLMNEIQPWNVIQTGDPRGDGWALPGESVRDELSPVRIQRGDLFWLINTRDSGHGAFAIALDRLPYLDGRYGVFGRITEGSETALGLTYADTLITVEILEPEA